VSYKKSQLTRIVSIKVAIIATWALSLSNPSATAAPAAPVQAAAMHAYRRPDSAFYKELEKALFDFHNRKPELGLPRLERLMKERQNDETLLLIRASVKLLMQDWRGCIADCNELLRRNPRLSGAYSRRGYCLCKLGQNEKGFLDLDRAISLQQLDLLSWNDYIDYRNEEKVLSQFRPVTMTPERERRIHLISQANRADVLRDQFKLVEAEAIIDKVAREANDDIGVHFLAGILHLNNGGYKVALQHFNVVDKMFPDCPTLLYMRAEVFSRMAEEQKAIDDYSRIIALDPLVVAAANTAETGRCRGEGATYDDATVNIADIYYLRSLRYLKLHQIEKALADLTKTIEANPYDVEALLKRAGIYNKLARTDKALADCNAAIAKQPKNWHCFEIRSLVFEKSGQNDKAVADCNQVIAIFKQNATAYLLRGHLYQRLKEYRKAIDDYTLVLQSSKSDDETYCDRGDCYLSMGDYDKAIADYTAAIDLEPYKNQHVFVQRSLAYERSGRKIEAAADREHAARVLSKLKETGDLLKP